MYGDIGEVVLPRRVKPQPTPDIVQGGDCGACVVGGILDLSVELTYDLIKSERKSIHFGEMQRMLRVAAMNGFADRIIEEPASWPRRWWGCDSFGRPAYMEALPWLNYVRMAIDAGYYGIACVDSERQSGKNGGTNHWVMICGARNRGHEAYDGVVTGEILVSCSMRKTQMQEEWVEARDFLMYRGGYDIMFVRPK